MSCDVDQLLHFGLIDCRQLYESRYVQSALKLIKAHSTHIQKSHYVIFLFMAININISEQHVTPANQSGHIVVIHRVLYVMSFNETCLIQV